MKTVYKTYGSSQQVIAETRPNGLGLELTVKRDEGEITSYRATWKPEMLWHKDLRIILTRKHHVIDETQSDKLQL